MQERIVQVQDKVQELIALANKLYGIKLPNIQLRFDLRGRVAGWAGRQNNVYFMRFNTDMMATDSWNHMFNDTVPHELAHIVCYFKPELGRNHNTGWKRVCRSLGGNGERCHKELVVYAKGNTYVYTTDTGNIVHLSQKKHKQVQVGRVLRFRRGKGNVNKLCAYELYNPKKHSTAAPKSVEVKVNEVERYNKRIAKVATPVVAACGSNADNIRARIKEAKKNGEGLDIVVQYGILTLGMSATLARTYAKNNWSKV